MTKDLALWESTSAVRLKPRKNGARNAVKRFESVEESIVVDIKRSRHEKGPDRHITTKYQTQQTREGSR